MQVDRHSILLHLIKITIYYAGVCNAHTNYGEHGLLGSDPSHQPELARISTGYFEARVIFALDLTGAFHENIFSMRNYGSNEYIYTDSISFRRLFRSNGGNDGIEFKIDNTGGSTACKFEPGAFNIVSKQKTTFSFGVRSSDSGPVMFISQDGGPESSQTVAVSCLPTTVVRSRIEVGKNMGSHGNSVPFRGIVTGVQVANSDLSESSIMDQYRHLSMAGQILGRPFVASFHAQWQYLDSTTYGTHGNQHAFHYCSSESGECVWCGQDGITTRDFALEYTNGADTLKLVAANAIVQSEWALWHCSVGNDGVMSISRKDASGSTTDWTSTATVPAVLPKAEFHAVQYHGSSLDNGTDNLMWGAVLGLRIDIQHSS